MNCSEFKDALAEYLLGELRGRRLAEFLRHAEECEACRRELEFELKLEEALREHPAPGLEEEVLEVLGELERGPGWWDLVPLGLALGGLAAALLLFLKLWPSLTLWSMLAVR